MTGWETEFKIEDKHRTCICGICNDKIGRDKPRVTVVVTAGFSYKDYAKWFHIHCVLDKLSEAITASGLDVVRERTMRLRELYNKIEELKQ